ncbi:hypothetical protein ERO13_D07G169366v2 [Gossypium hirsutum]|nr:hypothetical protein ERO13_D07G169366v2 [Gossypium hirsutum]
MGVVRGRLIRGSKGVKGRADERAIAWWCDRKKGLGRWEKEKGKGKGEGGKRWGYRVEFGKRRSEGNRVRGGERGGGDGGRSVEVRERRGLGFWCLRN